MRNSDGPLVLNRGNFSHHFGLLANKLRKVASLNSLNSRNLMHLHTDFGCRRGAVELVLRGLFFLEEQSRK